MRITFCLPNAGHVPIGGFKVVYEYANHLTARGHQVTLVHPALARTDYRLARRLVRFGRYIQRRLDGSHDPSSWFSLNPSVQSVWVPSLAERYVPSGDAVVATGWETAEWVSGYPRSKGRGFHLVQHHETWAGPEHLVERSWRMPLRKIVISRWLQKIGEERNQTCVYIPNGLDFSTFGMDRSPESRDPATILMLYHAAKWKGCDYAIAAIDELRRRIPELKLTMFGVPSGSKLPKWIQYVSRPNPTTLRALYNDSAIFLAPSLSEGWGLTASEAMMCGAAVAASDIGGHREFALQNQTAVIFKPGDGASLAHAVEQLQKHDLRHALSHAGRAFVSQFDWQRATDAFEKELST